MTAPAGKLLSSGGSSQLDVSARLSLRRASRMTSSEGASSWESEAFVCSSVSFSPENSVYLTNHVLEPPLDKPAHSCIRDNVFKAFGRKDFVLISRYDSSLYAKLAHSLARRF